MSSEGPSHIIRIGTRLLYSVEGISTTSRNAWRELVKEIFEDDLTPTQIDYHVSRNSKSYSDQEINNLKSEQTPALIQSIALMKAMGDKINETGDSVSLRSLEVFIRQLIGENVRLRNETDKAYKQMTSRVEQFAQRQVIRVKYDLSSFYIDFALRILLLIFLNQYVNDIISMPFYSLASFFLVPILVVLIGQFSARSDRKYHNHLITKYKIEDRLHFKYYLTSYQYTLLGSFIAIWTSVYLIQGAPLWAGLVFIIPIFLLYYALFFKISGSGRLTELEFFDQLNSKRQTHRILDHDENDEVIVKLESDLNSTTSRLDAYVLESALLGALSFSGFLQIMAENLVTFENLQKFATDVGDLLHSLVYLDLTGFFTAFGAFNSANDIFSLVSIETLICSFFFLTVIGSRLRFSDIADQVREAINMAKAYNVKEEFIIDHGQSGQSERFEKFNRLINDHLVKAETSMDKVRPIMEYMRYFRNGGIIMFLIILVSSSLLISALLSWLFILMATVSVIYFNRSAVNHALTTIYRKVSILVLGRAYWLLFLSILPFILGYFLRIRYHWENTDIILALGFILLSIFLIVTVILMPHYDAKFRGKIDASTEKRWGKLKRIWASNILIFIIGTAQLTFRLPGGGIFLSVAVISFSVLYYFVAFHLTDGKIFGFIAGLALSTAAIGVTFKQLVLPGHDQFLITSSAILFLVFILIKIQRSRFHILLINTCAIYFFLNLFVVFEGWYFISSAYDHRSWDYQTISKTVETRRAYQQLEAVMHQPELLREQIEITKNLDHWYINKFDTLYGQTLTLRYMKIFHYNVAEFTLTEGLTDQYDLALRAARHAGDIDRMFDYYYAWHITFNEPDLLSAMGKKEEARRCLEKILNSRIDEEHKDTAREKLLALDHEINGS